MKGLRRDLSQPQTQRKSSDHRSGKGFQPGSSKERSRSCALARDWKVVLRGKNLRSAGRGEAEKLSASKTRRARGPRRKTAAK